MFTTFEAGKTNGWKQQARGRIRYGLKASLAYNGDFALFCFRTLEIQRAFQDMFTYGHDISYNHGSSERTK